MTKRLFILIIIASSLIGINLWLNLPAWFQSPQTSDNSERSFSFKAEDFVVKEYLYPDPVFIRVKNDLFSPKKKKVRSRPATSLESRKPVDAKLEEKAETLVKQPSEKEILEQSSRSKLEGIKLEGIIEKNKQNQAFITFEGQGLFVLSGQKIKNRYLIRHISGDALEIEDMSTGIRKTIKQINN